MRTSCVLLAVALAACDAAAQIDRSAEVEAREIAEAPFSWHPEVVEVLPSGELALTSGPVRDPSGAVVGRFISVWRREPDGVWMIVFDSGS